MDRDRRKLLTALGLGGVGGLSGGVALERYYLEPKRDRRHYEKQLPIRRQNQFLTLEADRQSVPYGEAITFTITNTSSNQKANLGCNINWAIQRLDEDGWEHVTWTESRFYQACATLLGPGDTIRERVTMSKEWLENFQGLRVTYLPSGRYRFILYMPDPPEATEFELRH